MKAIAICCTPYQILNLINLSMNQLSDYKVDLIIVDHFEGYYDVYNKLKKSKVFNKIYLCKQKYITEQGLKEHKNLYFNIVENYIKDFAVDKYNKFIIGNNLIISNILFAKLRKINKDLEVVLIEDGVGTYTYGFQELKTYVKYIRRLLGNPIIEKKDIKTIYVYDKELLCYEVGSNVKVVDLPKINKEVMDLSRYVFIDTKSNKNTYNDIIYLDQPFTSEGVNISEKDVLNSVIKCFGSNISVKLHPRQDKDIYEGINAKILKESNVIWEIELLQIDNLKDKTIITVNSSAAFTPILLYGENINIILLNNILNESSNDSLVYRFINKFIKKYRSNIFLPNSYEELNKYKLKNKINIRERENGEK